MNKIRILIFLIILSGCLGIDHASADYRYWNHGRGYQPFSYATPDGVLIENQSDTIVADVFTLESPAHSFSLNFRSKNIHGKPSRKYRYFTSASEPRSVANPIWGVFIFCEKDTLALTFKTEEIPTNIESVGGLAISLFNGEGEFLKDIRLARNVNAYDGENLWRISVEGGNLILAGGNNGMQEILDYSLYSAVTKFGFFAGCGEKVLISDIALNFRTDKNYPDYQQDLMALESYFSESEDEMEGIWTIFDRELEESLLKLGGTNYKFACIKANDEYHFLYLEGAEVNAKNWRPGDLKAILHPDFFPGIYNVEWVDSMKDSLSKDIKAQSGEGNILTIQFPYQSSKIRLRKIPVDTTIVP